MPKQTIRNVVILIALTLIPAAIVIAQTTNTVEPIYIHGRNSSWQVAQMAGASMHKFIVVTFDQPDRRQSCRVRTFTPDKLVCSRVIGGARTYLPEQVIALITPGDDALRIRLVLGFNAGLGAAIWSTVVLAATCPACAVGTGIAALFFFSAAGATLIGDGQSEHFLYTAPGQKLNSKFRYIEDWP
jgi:hypothetical protein